MTTEQQCRDEEHPHGCRCSQHKGRRPQPGHWACERCAKVSGGPESFPVGSQQVTLCKRCSDTFWNRFFRFMIESRRPL